jgi:hypothetical protein
MAGGLEHPRAPRLVVLLGVLIALPTLAIGFFSDDWFMLAALRHRWPLAPAWWDLYDFMASTDAGVRAEVAQGPLSSAVLALDYRVFGESPVGWHVHAIAWWLALLLVMAALYRRLLPGATGTLALLVFAVVPANAHTYGWVSSSHMLVAAVPSMGALLAHGRAREEGWRAGRWLAPLLLAVGLAGSEAALGAVAFWMSYEALGPAALGSRRQRAMGAAPALLVVAVYLVVYRLAGGAMVASGGYVSPLNDPVGFASLAAVRLPMLLGHALLGVPVEASFGAPQAPFVLAGVAAVTVCALLGWASRDLVTPAERAALRWLLPGSLLAVLGTCGGVPGGRALLLANLASRRCWRSSSGAGGSGAGRRCDGGSRRGCSRPSTWGSLPFSRSSAPCWRPRWRARRRWSPTRSHATSPRPIESSCSPGRTRW